MNNASIRRIKAIVFDFDGVIADTEHLHYEAFCQVVRAKGLHCTWDEYVRDYIGFDDRGLFQAAYKAAGLDLDHDSLAALIQAKAAAFGRLTEHGVPTYEGIPSVIRALQRSYPLALCSGALRSDIHPVLDQLQMQEVFPVRVTAEDVEASKPNPACYRLAVERLSVALSMPLACADCLAIEDTPTGIAAAKGAGMPVWGLTHTHSADDLNGADRVVGGLPEVQALLGIAS